jgi:hypothetical protein
MWEEFHPDEIAIGEWIKLSCSKLSFYEKVYPNGYFILIKPFLAIRNG